MSIISSEIAIASGVSLLAGLLLGRLLASGASAGAAGQSSGAPGAEIGAPDFSGDEEVKMVLIVRNDLKMTKGKACAQCGHATLAAYKYAKKHQPKFLEAWEEGGQAKVALKVEDEATLLALQRRAREAGLVTAVIQDAGRTQIASGSRTVLAIGPGPKSTIDAVSGHLKLY